jgi:hypothetical protein
VGRTKHDRARVEVDPKTSTRASRSGTIREKVSKKAILTSFGQQDSTFRDYIRPNWPELEHREVATNIWGYFARSSALPEWQKYLSPEWTRANVSDVGPLGSSYRVWGDGRVMAAGFDNEDYFGLSGYTSAELRAMGYLVWTAPQPKDAWISEGDSSNFALLIDNGLRNFTNPSYGGWGGRQAVNPADPYQWRNGGVQDIGPDGAPRSDYSAGRWFEDFQLDFAARLKWSVTPNFADANHEPEVSVPTGVELKAKVGEKVRLIGKAKDPAVQTTAAGRNSRSPKECERRPEDLPSWILLFLEGGAVSDNSAPIGRCVADDRRRRSRGPSPLPHGAKGRAETTPRPVHLSVRVGSLIGW